MSYSKMGTNSFTATKIGALDAGLRSYMIAVYKHMSIALGLTGLVAFLVASSPALMNVIFGSPLRWIIIFAPLGMAIFMNTRFVYLSNEGARVSLWVYSALIGISTASLFWVYTGTSIARAFFITASAFGAMSIYGYTTKKDLSTISSFFMMGLIGIIIASVVNLFTQSNAMSFIISIAGVSIFSFLTAYETQRLKSIYYQIANDLSSAEKIAVFGALGLYMNFINLFINLLHFFGERRN
ncbi:MAG: Bax inhibitor-1/YccA family protein [Candidatus Midichloria sp.]|nr:MAG: Bax inhibitor-1/YccA family protein [Candidatus Midichloria sp.]